MRRLLKHLAGLTLMVAFATAASGQEICDMLFNDSIPIGLGHAVEEGRHIVWTDLSGSATTYNKPPYWYQARIKPCKGLPTAADIGPKAFGVSCDKGECSVGDLKVFHHFVPNAQRGDAVKFGEKKDTIEIKIIPKIGLTGDRVVIEKNTWNDAVKGSG